MATWKIFDTKAKEYVSRFGRDSYSTKFDAEVNRDALIDMLLNTAVAMEVQALKKKGELLTRVQPESVPNIVRNRLKKEYKVVKV